MTLYCVSESVKAASQPWRFRMAVCFSKNFSRTRIQKLTNDPACRLKLCVPVAVGACLPNTPCGNNAVTSSRFVPRNAVRKAVVSLAVVNVVVLGAIVHQATIGAPLRASPGTQKANPADATLAITFSSWHFCSTWNSTPVTHQFRWCHSSTIFGCTPYSAHVSETDVQMGNAVANLDSLGHRPKWNAHAY